MSETSEQKLKNLLEAYDETQGRQPTDDLEFRIITLFREAHGRLQVKHSKGCCQCKVYLNKLAAANRERDKLSAENYALREKARNVVDWYRNVNWTSHVDADWFVHELDELEKELSKGAPRA